MAPVRYDNTLFRIHGYIFNVDRFQVALSFDLLLAVIGIIASFLLLKLHALTLGISVVTIGVILFIIRCYILYMGEEVIIENVSEWRVSNCMS